jgi:hypothetical protein
MSITSHLTRFIEYSLATQPGHVNDEVRPPQTFDERTAAIAALPGMSKRLSALALHKLVGLSPDTVEIAHAYLLAAQGITRLADGAEAAVYRTSNETVLKVYKRTHSLTPNNQHEIVEVRRYDEKLLVGSLGKWVLPHNYNVAPHPVTGDRVVQASQPFVQFKAEDSVFPKAIAKLEPERLEMIEHSHPGAVSELAAFASRSLVAYGSTERLPDTHGKDNLVIGTIGAASPEIVVIDSYLERKGNVHLPVHAHIVQQMQAIIETKNLLGY